MNPENPDKLAWKGIGPGPASEPGAGDRKRGTIVALLRVGTRKARLSAALVLVVTGLVTQTATQAFAQARETVLYLDAPAVSTDRATNAGEVAKAYSDPSSPASSDAVAWLGVEGPSGADTAAPPRNAYAAFGSITAPDGEGTPAITAEAAYDAGETMLAQIEDGAPAEEGSPSEEELAAAGGAVRPELGDATQAHDEGSGESYEAPAAEQPESPDLASSPETEVPATELAAEPSGGDGLALEAPAPVPASAPAESELAAAPSQNASPSPETSLDTEPEYGATGPISEPEVQEGEIQDPMFQEQEVQEPELQDDEGQDPGYGGGELAEAGSAPVASPAPADDVPYEDSYDGSTSEDPGYEEPVASPDTGPTSAPSDDIASAPPASTPADDAATDDPASASPAPEESAPDEPPGQEVSEEQVSEVVIVQESETGEDGAAEGSPEFAPPADEADLADGTGPPLWAEAPEEEPSSAPASESQPEDAASPPPEQLSTKSSGEPSEKTPPADEDTRAASAPAEERPAGGVPDSHSGLDTAPVSEDGSGASSPSPTGDEPAGGGQDDPQNAASADEPAPAPWDGVAGQDTITSEEGGDQAAPDADQTGQADTVGQSPSPDAEFPLSSTVELDAGGQANQNDAPHNDAPHNDAPQGNAPEGGVPDRRPERPSEDHKGTRGDEGRDRRDRGGSGAMSADERIERVKENDGGAEAVQEKAQEDSGGGQQSVSEFQEEGSAGGSDAPQLPASVAPRIDDGSARRQPAQDRPQDALQSPGLELGGATSLTNPGSAGRPSKEPAAPEGRARNAAGGSGVEDAEEESSEGSQPRNYLIRTIEPAGEEPDGPGKDRVDSASAEGPAPPGTAPDRSSAPVRSRHTAEAPSRGEPDTGPVASQPSADPAPQQASGTPREDGSGAAGGEGVAERTPPVWDRQGVPSGRTDGRRAGTGHAAASPSRTRSERLAEQRAAERAERQDLRANRRAVAERAERREARQERIAYRRQVRAEEAAAARRAERVALHRAERREVRDAEIFAARVAERQAERRAARIAAVRAERQAVREQAATEQAVVERAAIREQRRQSRLAAGGTFGVQVQVAPAYREPVAQPAAVELAPVRKVRTQRFAPVEQPPAVRLPPARQVPAASLAPAPQVQAQPRQQLVSGGAGPVGGAGVAGAAGGAVQMPKSVHRATGW